MTLDLSALYHAKVENLERLARAMRVALPTHLRGERYRLALVWRLAKALEKEAVSQAESGRDG